MALVASLGFFAVWFSPARPQYLVDGLWILGICVWVSEVRYRSRGGLTMQVTPHLHWRDLFPIAAILIVFVAAWLPFYDNWRWAYTGDSLAWYTLANDAARSGLTHNLLSVHGVDDHFTYVHSLAFNSLMFIIEPSLLWHRVGKLIVSCLSLAAVYAFFTLMLGRWWAAAVVIATATNYVWLWFSYISYGHIDSHIFYFLTLLLGTLVWRRPEYLGHWMLCGLVGGFALFFTQTSWSAVAAVGLVLSGFALLTRRFQAAGVYVVSFLLPAIPILLQFPDFLKMTSSQASFVYEWDYLLRIFWTLLTLPYDWNYCRIGIQGAFLPAPLGILYLAGMALAGIAIVPRLRRTLRVPSVAPLLFGLLLWDVVLMTLTNNANPQPSSKRVYNLIPVQAFIALLPLYVLSAWSREWKVLRWVSIAVTAAVIGGYAVVNAALLMHPSPRIYGSNVFDAMIELRQRFPERHVVLFSSRTEMPEEMFGADSLVNQFYHVHDTVAVNPVLTSAELESTCAARALICYEPNFDAPALRSMVRNAKACLQPLPLLNSLETLCFDCEPGTCQTPMTDAEIKTMLAFSKAPGDTACH